MQASEYTEVNKAVFNYMAAPNLEALRHAMFTFHLTKAQRKSLLGMVKGKRYIAPVTFLFRAGMIQRGFVVSRHLSLSYSGQSYNYCRI